MIVTVVTEIIQKWKMSSQIHLSNLAWNTSKKIKQELQKCFWLKMMMMEVKVASLTKVVSLKYLQSNHKVKLNYNSSVDYLHWTVRSVFQLLSLMCQQKNTNEKKPKEGDQIEGKDMAMLVFNPCIMIFSPLFNAIMLTFTILTRKHWSSVFWQIANWSKHHTQSL